jgi:hypothetical protein
MERLCLSLMASLLGILKDMEMLWKQACFSIGALLEDLEEGLFTRDFERQ